MADHLDLERVGARLRLRLEDRADGRDGDERENEGRNGRPQNLERRVAMHVLGSIALAPPPIAEDHVEQDRFDEDEDEGPQSDEDLPKAIDFAIELRVVVE